MPSEKQNAVKITKGDVKRKLKSVPDWKRAGPDKIQGFWLKSFTTALEVLATFLNDAQRLGMFQVSWLKEELFQ